MGQVYLIHFDQPIGNSDNKFGQAQHYLGYSSRSLKRRISEHGTSSGSRIMQVVGQLGIGWKVVRTWPGNKSLERKLKNYHNSPELCPICKELRRKHHENH